jgi:hypothetical protein
MAEMGEQYRNESGLTLYGFIPPDAVVEVRNVGEADEAFAGDLVIEWDPGDNSGVLRAVAIPHDELTNNFARVRR